MDFLQRWKNQDNYTPGHWRQASICLNKTLCKHNKMAKKMIFQRKWLTVMKSTDQAKTTTHTYIAFNKEMHMMESCAPGLTC